MIKIKNEEIETIYLLSIQQAERLPGYILAIGDSWWLRSPGTFCGTAEVDENGNINYSGLRVDYNCLGVRPVLTVKDLDSLNFEIGETVKVLGLLAQYIGNNSVLLCKSIAKHKFDSKSSDYETSEIKQFIEEWLKERKLKKKVEMTKEEAVRILIGLWGSDFSACLTEEGAEANKMAVKALQQPERKKRKWILSDEQQQEDVDNGNYRFICSECGKSDIHSKAVIVSFCWNCGTDMRETE